MLFLVNDVIQLIFNFLYNHEDHVNFLLISKKFSNFKISRLKVSKYIGKYNNINKLINLEYLNFNEISTKNKIINDKTLRPLINLRVLYASSLRFISDNSLQYLTKLEMLSIRNLLHTSKDKYITDKSISKLVNLTHLKLYGFNSNIKGGIINSSMFSILTNLTSLNIIRTDIESNELGKLINLKYLTLRTKSAIYDRDISKLTNLTKLNLIHNIEVSDAGLIKLINLRKLILINCMSVIGSCTGYLTKLTKIIGL